MLQIKRSELKILAQNSFGNDSIESQNKILVMISTSVAARTSYTVVGEEKTVDFTNLISLHDRLVTQQPPHSSPLEHTAQAVDQEEYDINIKGQEKGWFRNYHGFKSYRQIIEEK